MQQPSLAAQKAPSSASRLLACLWAIAHLPPASADLMACALLASVNGARPPRAARPRRAVLATAAKMLEPWVLARLLLLQTSEFAQGRLLDDPRRDRELAQLAALFGPPMVDLDNAPDWLAGGWP